MNLNASEGVQPDGEWTSFADWRCDVSNCESSVRFCPVLKQVSDFFPDFEAIGRFCPNMRQRANLFRISGTFGKCLTDQFRRKFDGNSPISNLFLELA